MKNIGLFYSFNTKNTSAAAQIIKSELGEKVEAVNVEEATEDDFKRFSNFILGVPTWWDGELPNYWDEFLPCLEDDSMEGKTFALYGAGDQKGYPDNFVDAIGLMVNFIEARGGNIIGFVPNEGYDFHASKALRNGQFVGLPLDFENQEDMVKSRILNWLKTVINDFQ
jgi:flavodoxin I